MNSKSFFLILLTLTTVRLTSQCYKVEADFGGMDNSSYQAALEAAACQLRDSFPSIHQNDFKVFDFGFYSMNQYQQGGFKAVWETVKSKVASQSQYYLLFGKITNNQGVYTELWVDLVLPRNNSFTCIDLLSPNLRENLRKKYETTANEIHESNGKNPQKYHLAEIEVMKQLSEYVGGLKQCCDFANRSANQCSSCVLSNAQFERTIDEAGLLGASVSKVIDKTHPGMGAEEIGYTIESGTLSINLDQAITDFKAQVHSKFPNVSIKAYPFNFQDGCDNFDNIHTNFKASNVDIGIFIGVTGVNGQAGNLWWQMISKDDDPITPVTFNSDTCYYFDTNKKYTHKEKCTPGIRPRGILKNLDGFSFDFDFRFADPEVTPRTLTTQNIQDGVLISFGTTNEPLINKCQIMGKDLIFAQLAQNIPDVNGKPKAGAFDVHIFAPWSLMWESGGQSAPFDYSTKDYFLDRENFLFITDDGVNVAGHNFRNMGNFLWGAATYVMGVPQWMALAGAHSQNIFGEFGSGGLDAADDQYSIKIGRQYAKTMKWSTIYGGKKNVFK